MTCKVVPGGPDLPRIPITSHSRKGADWLIAQINATSMQINVPWMIFMVTSPLFDFEYKQWAPSATKQEASTQWKRMVKAIIADEEFWKYKKDLLSFWKHYLETPLVPNAMSALVIRILSVPVGSADAERAFSTFFHIWDRRRERLSAGHLEGRFFCSLMT